MLLWDDAEVIDTHPSGTWYTPSYPMNESLYGVNESSRAGAEDAVSAPAASDLLGMSRTFSPVTVSYPHYLSVPDPSSHSRLYPFFYICLGQCSHSPHG